MLKTENRSISLISFASPAETVGWRNQKPVSANEFCHNILLWKETIQKSTGKRFALFLNDTLEFSCALIAALQENKIVYLPSNALPATCQSLKQHVDEFLGQFPDEYGALSPLHHPIHNTVFNREIAVPDTSEVVVYTSGSTGEPQAIPKHIYQLTIEVKTLEAVFGSHCPDAQIVATVSHHHIYGLLFKVFWPLITKRPIHAISLNFPEELIAVVANRPSILISSPAHLKRFSESDVWKKSAHPIQTVFSSGGPLDAETAMAIRELSGSAPFEIYGSSETGGIAWRNRSSLTDEVWTPLPGVDWRSDPQSSILEVRSPHLYDTNWLQMADLVAPAPDNGFILKGRIDKIVKIEEKRVSLTAMERELVSSGLVNQCRVIVVDMEKEKRQRFAAFVVLNPDGMQVLETQGKLALNRKLRNKLSPFFEQVTLPKIWRYLDNLPVNVQGKTTYDELKALLNENDSSEKHLHSVLPEIHILEKTPDTCLLELHIPSTLVYFKGHFPEKPILPGVVQLDWVITYGRQFFDITHPFSGMRTLKFQQIIEPDSSIKLSLQFNREKQSLSFRYFSETGQHGSGMILFNLTNQVYPNSAIHS